ncbi:galactose ABC transporter substrate-binding protein [Clostridium butyricum]|uniref:galactose ABC transporter substrate-binding protein n=1 Tax=Clostridium butyricum TaxID=1492 RepID=UPI0012B7D472|nr:galactose ABC transporter substrate-binding protein [Clostridium butyricum]
MLFYIKKISSVFLTVFIFNFYIGCSFVNNKINKSDSKTIKIGVTLFDQNDPFISSLAKQIENVSREKEGASEYKINVNVVDSTKSVMKQYEQVDNFIDRNYDVICVSMVDRTTASSIIDRCKKAEIPLIFFNSEPVEEDMNLWNKVYYVGGKSEEAGKMQGEIIKDFYEKYPEKVDKNNDGKLQYVMLEGDPEHQDTLIRTENCVKSMRNNGIEVEKIGDYIANWQSSQAYEIMTRWINEYDNKIEVVFCNNDAMALGAIKALENAKVNQDDMPVIVGTDGISDFLPYIKNNNMIATVFNNYKLQGKYIFDIAYELATNKSIDNIEELKYKKNIKVSYKKITADNVDEFIFNDNIYD